MVTALLGLALAIHLIIHAGAEEVAQAMLVVGWGLVPITLRPPRDLRGLCVR